MEHFYVLDPVPRAVHRSSHLILTAAPSYQEYEYPDHTNEVQGGIKFLLKDSLMPEN